MNLLIVVDMQNDFIDGALGTPEALCIVEYVKQKAEQFQGEVIYTRDTHTANYLATREGRSLPVPHCIEGTHGWQIQQDLLPATTSRSILDKPGFGSPALADYIAHSSHFTPQQNSIELVGLCTDICIITNALLLQSYFPETPIIVDSLGCAGVTPHSHNIALEAMRNCQIIVTP